MRIVFGKFHLAKVESDQRRIYIPVKHPRCGGFRKQLIVFNGQLFS